MDEVKMKSIWASCTLLLLSACTSSPKIVVNGQSGAISLPQRSVASVADMGWLVGHFSGDCTSLSGERSRITLVISASDKLLKIGERVEVSANGPDGTPAEKTYKFLSDGSFQQTGLFSSAGETQSGSGTCTKEICDFEYSDVISNGSFSSKSRTVFARRDSGMSYSWSKDSFGTAVSKSRSDRACILVPE
jgi:hypothetical protein